MWNDFNAFLSSVYFIKEEMMTFIFVIKLQGSWEKEAGEKRTDTIRIWEIGNCICCQRFLDDKVNLFLLVTKEGVSVLPTVLTVDTVDIKYWVFFYLND